MNINSKTWFRFKLSKDLLYINPDRHRNIFFGIGDPRGSKKTDNGDCFIYSSPEVIEEYKALKVVSVNSISEVERLTAGLGENFFYKLKINDLKKLKKRYKELTKELKLPITVINLLIAKPSNWDWHDRNKGEYQFGDEGVIRVGGKKAKKIFQEAMDLFSNTGKIQTSAVKNIIECSAEEIRVCLNYLNKRKDFKTRCISFMGSGKGYYQINYSK